MQEDGLRYAQMGWTYEKFNPLRKETITWHLRQAREFGGPLLELACGSGRLCAALALAGFKIDAIDRSSNMLTRALMRIGSLDNDTRSRIKLIQTDISNFPLDSSYKLIIIADNSLAELPATARTPCLQSARKHLAPDGRLLLTARVYDADTMFAGRIITSWSEPVTHPTTGITVRRKVELQLSADKSRMEGRMTYEITQPDKSIDFETCPVEFAHYTRKDYNSLLGENGWHIEAEDSPITRNSSADSSIVRFICAGR